MNILITNDDSIHAEGLKILIEAAKSFGNIYVVAPEHPQSGMASAMTVSGKIKYKRYQLNGIEAYSIVGTPADCIRVAHTLFDVSFDMVLSGVNQGANISSDIYHSGTIGAVYEGLILGIPGIAFSGNFYDFSIPRAYTKAVIQTILKHDLLSLDYVVSVNFPEQITEPKFLITHQGRADETALYEIDDKYLTPLFSRGKTDDQTSDIYAYYNGFISITPLKYDKTDDETYKKMKAKLTALNDDLNRHCD